jgi:hypothetical protein
MPAYGTLAEALLQPKRARWFTGVVLAPYLPWTFPGTWQHNLQFTTGGCLFFSLCRCPTPQHLQGFV